MKKLRNENTPAARGWLSAQCKETKRSIDAMKRWAKDTLENHAPGPAEDYDSKVRERMLRPCRCVSCDISRLVLRCYP